MHEEYITQGEQTYIGKVDTLYAVGGYKRIQLGWKLNIDPRISTCIITWIGNDNPIEIPVDRSVEFMNKIIDLPEGKYIFSIVTKSSTGKESLPQTISGEVYGDKYQSRLPQRGINSITATPEGATISWASEEGCIKTKLTYNNKENKKVELMVPDTESSSLIPDFVPGSEFTITSFYEPEKGALDYIESVEKVLKFPSFYIISKEDWDNKYLANHQYLDRSTWTAEASTEELGGEGPVNGRIATVLDNNPGTFWHSAWKNASPTLPHIINIDMQEAKDITAVEVARRVNNKDLKTISFSASLDNNNWETLGEIKFPNNPSTNAIVLLLVNKYKCRYIKGSVTESYNAPHASISEIKFTTSK
jgi:F5/8 type C domain.